MRQTVEVNGEKVHLKKDFLGWKVIHPYKNEDGKINWGNLIFGGKANTVSLIIYVIVLSMIYFGVKDMMNSCNEFASHPCDYVCCPSCKNVSMMDYLNNETMEWVSQWQTQFNLTGDNTS
jgi:hypothetical protein